MATTLALIGVILYAEFTGHRFSMDKHTSLGDSSDEESRLAYDENGNLADFTKLEQRPVELGRNSDEYIEVLSGLTEGETVFIPNAASSFMNAMMGM